MYEIENDVPLIDRQNARHRMKSELRVTVEALEIGQSFVFKTDQAQPRVSQKVCLYARKLDRKFVTRGVEGGYRIWRIA